MLSLTPSERRGALTVALLLLIGTGYDLVRTRAPLPAPDSISEPNKRIDLDSSPPPPPAVQDAGGTSDRAVGPGTRVDLNRASAAELDALPGIGPVLAARIIDHRQRYGRYRRTDDLLAVPGIGPGLFARLEGRVTVGAAGEN